MDHKFQVDQLMNLSKRSGCYNVNTSKKTGRVGRGERFKNINIGFSHREQKKICVEMTK